VSDACIFCAIVAGEAPASVVWEDAVAIAFLDINPLTPGHVLVVPREHAGSLAELDPALGGRVFAGAMAVAAGVRASALRVDGVNLFLADGAAAGQDVFHVHVHVIPRFQGDGLEIRHAGTSPPREVLDETAAAIRTGLARSGA
jgi:histidine triad (HIT) family protein